MTFSEARQNIFDHQKPVAAPAVRNTETHGAADRVWQTKRKGRGVIPAAAALSLSQTPRQ